MITENFEDWIFQGCVERDKLKKEPEELTSPKDIDETDNSFEVMSPKD